jgi:aminopeptidase N
MWFGDLVTMRWWDDLWLNESFADFMASYALQGATRFKNAWVHFANLEKAQALVADQLSTTHPIVAHYPDTDAVRLGFDAITYQKGASVLKQLVAYVGDKAFFEGLKRYLSANAFDNAELADFLAALEQVAPGKDLEGWARAWLQTAGVNTIVPRVALHSGRIESASLVQTAQSDRTTLRPHLLRVGLYRENGGKIRRLSSVSKAIQAQETPLPELQSEKMPDILLPNDEDLTYAKIRLDPNSDLRAKERLIAVEDPLARSLLWGCFWDRTRDAEYASGAWMELFYAHVSDETDPMVLSALFSRSQDAIRRFIAPERMESATGRFAQFAKERMESSKPGSDEQLSWAQAFYRTAIEGDQLDFLKSLLDGGATVPGLALDFDRRWQAIQTLAEQGRVGLEEIQKELKRDPTDMGQRYALQARAALPNPEAKAWAWKEATQNLELPLRSKAAIAQGFWCPFQEDVLNPYVMRYFEELPEFWQRFGPDEAIVLTRSLFPSLVIEEDTAFAVERLLEATDLPTEAKRILMEKRDELNRAIRARRLDGASS